MEGIASIIAAALVIAYVGIAVWCICKRRSVGGSIGTSIGFLFGGFVVVPVAQIIATFICWAVVIFIILAVLGAICGG